MKKRTIVPMLASIGIGTYAFFRMRKGKNPTQSPMQ
ncbi:hypothetical protein GGQ92_000039 [Gracilibacillus halotolerans]|uniref:Uncharacterized protein n=1 Tax=Gracilibacillus halotolerans TaxID=74386 RepID=A0A841RGV3_9BACI|nr:hypothetical protein [Gracilibacillus halotolerans]